MRSRGEKNTVEYYGVRSPTQSIRRAAVDKKEKEKRRDTRTR